MSELSSNWRNIEARRERKHSALEQLLAKSDGLFPNFKDLMIFAASVGYEQKERKPLEGETVGITLDTYSTDGKDGYIYLFGLLALKDGKCLKIENLRETVKVYEEYCNAGLYKIQSWLDENPSANEADTILGKMLDSIIAKHDQIPLDPGSIDLEL